MSSRENVLLNIAEYCLKSHKNLTKPALILVDDIGKHRILRYDELYHQTCRLWVGLKSSGLPAGSVICIQADEIEDLLLLFLAANAAGFVPCPLLLSLSDEEVNFILKNSKARIFCRLVQHKAVLNIPSDCLLITHHDYEQLKTSPFQEMQATTHENDPAFIFYTSGSSGIAKGVLHAQHAILGRKPSIENWLTLNANDIVMQTDNLCWTYSMFTGFLDPLSIGATALIIIPSQRSSIAEDKISGEKWLKILDFYQVTVMASTPDIYYTISTSPFIKEYKNHFLRQAGSAGAFLSHEIRNLWESYFHLPIYIALGMSEISTFISMGPKVPYRKDTLGKIQPGRKVAILPIENGFDPVSVNTCGMLAVHKDELGLMIGYVAQQDESKHVEHTFAEYRGDWFLTQDIVSIDEAGYIHYYGRNDLILKIEGGFRVSPEEIESKLKQNEIVYDAVCSSIIDPTTKSTLLVAYIITKEPSQEVALKIYDLLAKQVSDYKLPSYIYFVNHFPLNVRGKVIRKELNGLVPLQKYKMK